MKNDPRVINAKFTCKCAETGKPINQGESCIYYRSSKKVFCHESKQAQAYNEYMFDLQCLNANY